MHSTRAGAQIATVGLSLAAQDRRYLGGGGHSIWRTVCWRDKSARRKPTHPLNLKLSLAIATPKRHSCVNSGHCRTRDGNAAGLDAFDAKSPQRREELAQGRANAVEKHGVARRLVSPIVRPSDRALQVVHRPTEAWPQSWKSRIRARPPHFVRRGVACSRPPLEPGAGGRAGRRSRSQPRPRRLLAVGREAFTRQMDFVVRILMRHPIIPLALSAGRRRTRSARSARLAMIVVDFLEFRVDHVGAVAGARTLSA